jgi:sensor histidine kinase regulating citrate/malate metabolism
LKNQIIAIRTEKDADIRKKYLEDLENSIKYYEAQYKTGNEVLDTILTSKLITCLDNNIIVTCIADGKLLNFISAMDLCSIFGNAIDNAIESVLKIDDKEKRLIKIATYAENELLLIRFENFYLNPLQISHGNFVTTKKDTRFHGYRLKSIKSTVEKYGGNVSITTSNNWFRLIILIPIPRAET